MIDAFDIPMTGYNEKSNCQSGYMAYSVTCMHTILQSLCFGEVIDQQTLVIHNSWTGKTKLYKLPEQKPKKITV